MNNNRVYIFDTTLRDGEQSPGVKLNAQEKLEIAQQLTRLGVDIIEAGFPISSPGDFEAVKLVAEKVRGPVIAALARVRDEDIDRAWEAIKGSKHPRIHVFCATSEVHMRYKLKMSEEEVLEAIIRGIKRAKRYTEDIEFSPEDGFRSDRAFLCQVVKEAIRAGATTINIPDTVGYATPEEIEEMFLEVQQKVPETKDIILSVHCHDDLGLAVANSLASLKAGARQVECAVNGIGERAGNAALEEVVMALYTRKDYYGFETGIKTKEIYRTSRLVSTLSGIPISPTKAIVGKNAFLHEAGIHQDGVLKERTTYEIMNPEMLGIVHDNIYLGKHSGRHAFSERLKALGFNLTEEDLDRAFKRFKELADRKQEISDRDLEALVENEVFVIPEKYQLEYLQVSSGNRIVPTATVGIRTGDKLVEEAACGEGPVDAVFRAIDKATEIKVELKSYNLDAVTGGKDAQGQVTVKISSNGKTVTGRGVSTDIIEASAKAYIHALNKLVYEIEIDNVKKENNIKNEIF